MSGWWFNVCCGPRCECECSCCDNNEAPCCWKVVIADAVDCAAMNGTYYLVQDPNDECHWSAFHAIGGSPCVSPFTSTTIDLYVTCAYGTYTITVSIGAYVWSKSYGATAPTCCRMTDEVLPWSATGPECDSSDATCTISDAEGDPNCTPTGGCCSDAPEMMEVTLAGFVPEPHPSYPGGTSGCDCDPLNQTFLLQGYGSGPVAYHQWWYCGPVWSCDWVDIWGNPFHNEVSNICLAVSKNPTECYGRVTLYGWLGGFLYFDHWFGVPGMPCSEIGGQVWTRHGSSPFWEGCRSLAATCDVAAVT